MSSRLRRRRPDERESFGVPLNQRTGPPPGPEILPWYWHPDREGAQPPPAAFVEKLKAIDPGLGVVFSPVHERYIIWVRNPKIQNALCRGWQLLFLWEHPVTHAFLPLNELVFHNLFYISRQRWPNAQEYFDRIQADIEREKAARMKTFQDERQGVQRDFFKTNSTISSAGSGSKSALSESIIPSPGEAAWRAETRKQRLPSEMIRHSQDEKEKEFYGRD